jgi:hypothetical protein
LRPPNVIPYLHRCIIYAIIQNSSNEAEMDRALSRIVPHVFGEHEMCVTVGWCRYKDDPLSFR